MCLILFAHWTYLHQQLQALSVFDGQEEHALQMLASHDKEPPLQQKTVGCSSNLGRTLSLVCELNGGEVPSAFR